MAVPSSGEISLGGIYSELDADDYGELNDEGSEVSLLEASNGTIATINTNNASSDRPDGSAPHAMSEFYGYDHDSSAAATSFSSVIADFTITAVVGGSTVQELKTFTLNNGSGNLTGVSSDNSAFETAGGTLSYSISAVGDPGIFGTANSATGFTSEENTATLSGVSWSSSQTVYVRFRFAPNSSGFTETHTFTLTNNSVQDTVQITKLTNRS